MDKTDFVVHKVTKPIQLLAAWLSGLVMVNGSFLTAAGLISAPPWVPPLLVVASIMNVPLFIAAVFLLQTKFRPEMQEDSFYFKYLEAKDRLRLIHQYEASLVEFSERLVSAKIAESEQAEDDATRAILLEEIRELNGNLEKLRIREKLTEQIVEEVASAGEPSPAMAKRFRVLNVEDHPINAKLLQNLLSAAGYIVDVVQDGEEALRVLRELDYSAIFMDVQLPTMDGLETTREIRRLEGEGVLKNRVPIIALTAYAMTGDREKCLAAGMDDYLSKPYKTEDLIAMAEKYSRSSVAANQAAPADQKAPLSGR